MYFFKIEKTRPYSVRAFRELTPTGVPLDCFQRILTAQKKTPPKTLSHSKEGLTVQRVFIGKLLVKLPELIGKSEQSQ